MSDRITIDEACVVAMLQKAYGWRVTREAVRCAIKDYIEDGGHRAAKAYHLAKYSKRDRIRNKYLVSFCSHVAFYVALASGKMSMIESYFDAAW